MEIEDICRMARAEGLSYGQYVYVHADELAGKRPVQRLRAGERSCRRCGQYHRRISCYDYSDNYNTNRKYYSS